MVRRRFLVGALLGVLFAIGWWAGRGRASNDLYTHLDQFVEVLRAVQSSYVDEVDARDMMRGGLKGMLRGLDPASRYLDPSELAAHRTTSSGEVEGIGAWVDIREGYPVVIAPLHGSPAARAGLRSGDFITHIDSVSTFGLGLEEARAKMIGSAGTQVRLRVARKGEGEPREVMIQRERLLVPAVPYAFLAAPGVGYVRVATFHERSAAEFAAAVDSLRRLGARAAILDLRGNPGGVVDQAVAIAGTFLPSGTRVVSVVGRDPAVSAVQNSSAAKPETGWPLVVLIDSGSASASEIVAGALQDLDRAVIVGESSFGKGSVQNLFPLRGRAGAVQMTTAYYHTPSGRTLHRITRDPLAAGSDEEDEEDDAAPDSALSFQTSGGRSVRGGGGVTPDVVVSADSSRSLTPLPLDAASAPSALALDPVVQRALAILRKSSDARAVFASAGVPVPSRTGTR